MEEKEMYYNRELTDSLSKLIESDGKLRWLFDFVKTHSDLDFLIGKEWISVYRGLSRCITINPKGKIDGADTFKKLVPNLYVNINEKIDFKQELIELLSKIEIEQKFNRYYNNKKEGYFQNAFSRIYGILSDSKSEFVIIDKEVVVGYNSKEKKEELFGKVQKRYKELQEEISSRNAKRYGKDLQNKPLGNELDFLALDNKGNILLIEFKHGGKECNTAGIYLSPLQIGLYYDIFTEYYRNYKTEFEKAIFDMLKQKQGLGLINSEWENPKCIKKIIPVLVISEYNQRSSAQEKFKEILEICRENFGNNFLSNLQTYNYVDSQLKQW